MSLITIAIGMLVGAIMGVTGAGGGVLAVPALSIALGLSLQQASPMALFAMIVSAGVGAFEAWRHRLVRYRAAALIALCSLPFTSLGLAVAHRLPQAVLMQVFALVMLIAAARSLLQSRDGTLAEDSADWWHQLGPISPQSGRFVWRASTVLAMAGVGATTGFLAGLLGVGGGFIIVPMLRRFTELSMHATVGTSLLIVALVSAGASANVVAHGISVPLDLTAQFAGGSVLAMLIARRLARQLDSRQIQIAFSLLAGSVALMLLIRSAGV